MSLTPEQLEKLMTKIDSVSNAAKTIEDEQREKAAKEKAKKEEARMKELVEKASGEQREKLDKAYELINALSEQLDKQGAEGFAKQLADLQEEVRSKSEEISQLLAAREGKNSIAIAVGKELDLGSREAFEAEAEKAVLLGYVMQKGIEETEFGAQLVEKVNQSSSIEVSSDSYETVFSARILRDIQDLLVVGALFPELPMTTANLTMQIEPDSGEATWVGAATYGTTATTGNEITAALTDITFTTHKLAARAYMTDETSEDAITSLLPIIRRHLIESHVKAIEKAFMGTGANTAPTGRPTGLLDFAAIDGNARATAATATGSVKVQASQIHALRRRLGLKGLRLESLALIVSMDAYYDLLEDQEWQDVNQVGANNSIKLQGQVGRVYGLPVVVSSYFPAKAASAPFCTIVYKNDFIVPRQRAVTVEYERRASEQRDAYYVTQRVNLQRFFAGNNVVSGTYAA